MELGRRSSVAGLPLGCRSSVRLRFRSGQGRSWRKHPLDVTGSTTVENLKQMIWEKVGVPTPSSS